MTTEKENWPIGDHREAVLEWALRYIENGWLVFPLHSIDENRRCTCGKEACPDAGKHPRQVRGLKHATKDEALVREWFSASGPLSNIGVLTGEKSGITILDIDIGPGKEGAESWAEAIGEAGEPDTLMAKTGSGGMHVVFKYNSVLKTASNVLGKGVDCRNDGGYIVAAPSRHRSGGLYEWMDWEDAELGHMPAHLSRRKSNAGRPRRGDLTRQKFTIEQVAAMLDVIPADDRDQWRNIGIILGRAFNRTDEAWQLYQEWSVKWGGKEGRNHSEIMHQAFYELSQERSEKELTLGTIVKIAIEHGWSPKFGEVPVDNFVYFGPGNNYIYRVTGSLWIAEAVNAACSPVNENGNLKKPADWLRANMLATSMTKDPALDGDYVKGIDYREGQPITQAGAAVFNNYRGPNIELGDAKLAGPFLEHVLRVFPKEGDADQFLNYMAHRVQKPAEKPRFALLIAGDQGVGKDTAVEMCCPAIGAWNVANIEPSALDTDFNEYAANVLIRISEAANLQDMSKWAFNERTKVLIAGTPDNLSINPKYGQKYSARLHCGVIVTTNHLATGIYIPQDDRRYDVIEAATKEEMGLETEEKSKEYFSELWDWFVAGGGSSHVAAWLFERSLEGFSASNGQRKTEAHRAVVASGMGSDGWALDAIIELGEPRVVRSDAIAAICSKNGMQTKELSAKLLHAMMRIGYKVHRNPNRKDGRWEFEKGVRATIYALKEAKSDEIEVLRKSLVVPF